MHYVLFKGYHGLDSAQISEARLPILRLDNIHKI